jgi:hypothetical protein
MSNYLRGLKERTSSRKREWQRGIAKLDDVEQNYGLMLRMDFVEDEYKAIAGDHRLNTQDIPQIEKENIAALEREWVYFQQRLIIGKLGYRASKCG